MIVGDGFPVPREAKRLPYKNKPTIVYVGDDAHIVPPATVFRADVGIRPYEMSVKEIEK